MAKSNFPSTLYAVQDRDGDATFEVAYRTLDDIPDDEQGNRVAIYELKRVGTYSVTKVIEDK